MARKRMIDPSLWADEDFGYLSPYAQILFIGLISNADDEGRLPGNPTYLTSTIMPYSEISKEESKKIRDEVVSKMNSVILYKVRDKEYIQLKNWQQYQTIRKPQKSKYPAPSLQDDNNYIETNINDDNDNNKPGDKSEIDLNIKENDDNDVKNDTSVTHRLRTGYAPVTPNRKEKKGKEKNLKNPQKSNDFAGEQERPPDFANDSPDHIPHEPNKPVLASDNFTAAPNSQNKISVHDYFKIFSEKYQETFNKKPKFTPKEARFLKLLLKQLKTITEFEKVITNCLNDEFYRRQFSPQILYSKLDYFYNYDALNAKSSNRKIISRKDTKSEVEKWKKKGFTTITETEVKL